MAGLLAGIAAAAWLWFLALGRARGPVKRLALRATLLVVIGALVAVAAHKGLLTRTSVGFRIALLMALLTVAVGYLYMTRFCGSCGRMVRNLKPPTCSRCGAWLPIHGMTTRVRRPGDDRRWDPLEKRPRPAPPRDTAPRA
ncbi:MAG: hypothetical protein ABR567_20070 [Myxococcales bacterium]|nr:hypothetical protein [Myxococcales bacterium]